MAITKKGIPIKYVSIVQELYQEVETNIRICERDTTNFPIMIDLHQGSALGLFFLQQPAVLHEIT